MAAGTLSRRIHRVLRRPAESRWEGAWRRGALAGIAFVGAPIAAVQFVSPAMAPAIAAAPARPAASASPAPVSAATPAATASSVAIETAKAANVIAVAAQAPVAPIPAVEPVDPEAIRALVESTREVRSDALAAASDARRLAEQARVQTAAAMAGMRPSPFY